MKALVRFALSVSAAAALLGGCSGSQQPIGSPGATPQTSALATHGARGKSWITREAARQDLLYASDNATNAVYVFSYPRGHRVGTLTGFNLPAGECVDNVGNIWIVNQTPPEAIEYAHGGTAPLATLSVPGGSPIGCAVDPTTGNLAVTNQNNQVSIFPAAQGSPTTYTDSQVGGFRFCSYDNSGNLFIAAGSTRTGILVELPNGSGSFTTITIKPHIEYFHLSGVQWDGKYLAIGGVSQPHSHKPVLVYQLQISGKVGMLEGTTKLLSRKNSPVVAQFWIQGSAIVQSSDHGEQIAIWDYPAGGNPIKLIKSPASQFLFGTAVSLAK
jgi:hypothetical protein